MLLWILRVGVVVVVVVVVVVGVVAVVVVVEVTMPLVSLGGVVGGGG